MGFKNEKWIKMKSIGMFRFIFLKPLFISIYAFLFFICISFAWYGFDYGFDTTINNFIILFTSFEIIKIIIAFTLLAIILIANNCILWVHYKIKMPSRVNEKQKF